MARARRIGESVECTSHAGVVLYVDAEDHFRNATLRLLDLTEDSFLKLLDALAEQPGPVSVKTLGDAYRSLHPGAEWLNPASEGTPTGGPYGLEGRLVHRAIAERKGYGLASSPDRSLGWLVLRGQEGGWLHESAPLEYEERYFEGDRRNDGGYGSYSEQRPWRLEKASRQVRMLQETTGLRGGRALDVGSSYGYFRKALDEAGFEHDGVEVSAYARNRCRELFGFETMPGPLGEGLTQRTLRYDLLTLWDTLEHVGDPLECLCACSDILRPAGFLAIRTPNLWCPEHEVFGGAYHSLKREHLHYLTPDSLAFFAPKAGLKVVRMTTTSHLLAGFFDHETLTGWERDGRGSDIVAVFQRT